MLSGDAPAVIEPRLKERLDSLRASYANHDDLVRELEEFVRTAPDDQIVRINPIQYAADHGRDKSEIIPARIVPLHSKQARLARMQEQINAARSAFDREYSPFAGERDDSRPRR